jgi:hypothetical protein
LMESARLWEDTGEEVYDYNYANFDMSIHDSTVHANACLRDSESFPIYGGVSCDDHVQSGRDIVFLMNPRTRTHSLDALDRSMLLGDRISFAG